MFIVDKIAGYYGTHLIMSMPSKYVLKRVSLENEGKNAPSTKRRRNDSSGGQSASSATNRQHLSGRNSDGRCSPGRCGNKRKKGLNTDDADFHRRKKYLTDITKSRLRSSISKR